MIIIGIFFVVIFGIVLLSISPQVSEVRSLRLQYAARRAEFEYTQELSRTFDELRARYITLRENGGAEEIEEILPRDMELPELLVQLEAIAAQTTGGVIMRTVDFSPQSKEGGPSEIKIHMRLSASYGGIKEYLKNLSKNRRLIDIDSIEFATPAENEEESVHNFTLEAHAYFQP